MERLNGEKMDNDTINTITSVAVWFVGTILVVFGCLFVGGHFAKTEGYYFITYTTHPAIGIQAHTEIVYRVMEERSLGEDRCVFESLNKDEAIEFYDKMLFIDSKSDSPSTPVLSLSFSSVPISDSCADSVSVHTQ